MVQAIIYKPNEHADEYVIFVDDVKEVSFSRHHSTLIIPRSSADWTVRAVERGQEHSSRPIHRYLHYREYLSRVFRLTVPLTLAVQVVDFGPHRSAWGHLATGDRKRLLR